MKYYKNPNTNEVFAYESDGSQDAFILPDLVQMTEAEVQEHLHPTPTPPTQEEVFKQYDIAVELYLDSKAKAAGYYDPLERIPAIDRACSYAGFFNPYQSESQIFVEKRAAVWAYVYGELAKVQSGERELPTKEGLTQELDAEVWGAS